MNVNSFPTSSPHGILEFCAKTLLLMIAALIPVVAAYIWLDPYRVVRGEAAFLPNPTGEPFGEWEGRKMEGPHNSSQLYYESFLRHSKAGNDYRGFIFGSSISLNIHTGDWKDAASIPDSIEIRHLGANGETPTIIADKLTALDRRGTDLRYVLIVMDADRLAADPTHFISDINSTYTPPLSPIRPFYSLLFHYQIYKTVMNIPFLASYIPSVITDSNIQVMSTRTLWPHLITFNPLNGDENPEKMENLRDRDALKFRETFPIINQSEVIRYPIPFAISRNPAYLDLKSILSDPSISLREGEGIGNYLRDGFPHNFAEAISPQERKRGARVRSLTRIATILHRHNSNYLLLLTPYPKGSFTHPADLAMLYEIFGEDNVKCLDDEYMILNRDSMMLDLRHFSPAAGRYFINMAYDRDTIPL